MKTNFSHIELTFARIAELCHGKLVLSGMSGDEMPKAICTDSREVDKDTIFVAIVGERVDGHDYMSSAARSGCRFFIATRIPEMNTDMPYGIILVENIENALAAIGGYFKSECGCFTVGITGSVGKTTTKEFVYSVLSEKAKTFKTEGNFNSVIGMPMSMVEITKDSGAAVFEMGMSGFGEISALTKIAKPDVAIITTIGTSHMELLGSRENICRAKMEIAEGLDEGGILILNGDEPLLQKADKGGRKVFYVGIENRDADLRALNIRMSIGKTTFDILSGGRIYTDIELPVMGQHNVYAALFAFSVGRIFGMDIESIRRGLLGYKGAKMRQNIYDLCGITVIEDCYNASPESMRSALDVLHELSARKDGARTVALLGDMLELGENSPQLHRGVGEYLVKSGVDVLLTYGERAKEIALAAQKCGMKAENIFVNPKAKTPEVSGEMLLHVLRKGDILLAKASRSIAAEEIIEYLRKNKDKLPM